MRIAIVHNEPHPIPPEMHWLARSNPAGIPLPPDFQDASEFGILAPVADIEHALRDLGECPLVHAAMNGTDLVEFLACERPEVVVNCCESLRGRAALEMSVAAVFDLLGIAYTGSSALTLGIALDKAVSKALFQANGVPTPPFVVARTEEDIDRVNALTFPLIVKPVAEDASAGIDNAAVVHDRGALAKRVRFVWSEFAQAALVEEFIDGRELNVSLLADACGDFEMLPISEISFEALPPGVPAIVSYDAKWRADSAAYRATPVTCPADVDATLAERVRTTAVAAARTVNLRDYGRVDMRLRSSDEAIFVLEVNPNPDLSVDAGFMRAARASGRTFAATVEQIVSCAWERARQHAIASGMS
jgi:D-alanine-D-alanine ligase